MPTAREIRELLRGESDPSPFLGDGIPPGPSEGWVEGALEFGGDLLGGIFDVLDRPGRAGRNLLFRGDLGQAASALMPGFLAEAVGLERSRPFFSSEFLEDQGVGEGFEGPLGITGRSLGGLFLDIVTDPFTLGLGGVTAKLGKAALGKAGAKTFSVLDKARQAGGIRGGAAETALGFGSLFSRRLGMRARGLEASAADDLLKLQETKFRGPKHATDAVAAAEQHELARALKGVSGPDQMEVLALAQTPGIGEALHAAGLTPTAGPMSQARRVTHGIEVAKEDVPLFAAAEAERITAARAAETTKAIERFSRASPAVQKATAMWLNGSPIVRERVGANLGKWQREAGKMYRDILQENKGLEFMDRWNVRHVTQKLDPRKLQDPEKLAHEWIADLANRVNGKRASHVMSGRQVRDMIAKAKSGTDQIARKRAVDLDDLDKTFSVLVDSPVELAALEDIAYSNVVHSTDYLKAVLADRRFAKPQALARTRGGAGPLEAVAEEGWRAIEPGRFPKWMQERVSFKDSTGVRRPFVFQEAVAHELERTLKRVAADPLGHAVQNGLRTFNRMFSGWTIALFPATHLRNIAGNLFSNYVSGHGYKPADLMEAFQILRGNAKGVRIGEETLETGAFVQEALRGRVLKSPFQGSELNTHLGRAMFEARRGEFSTAQRLLEPALNPVTRTGFGIMQWGDDVPKLAHYLSKRRAGATAEESAASVQKYLYGGQPLTGFEEGVRDFAAPFYAWTRFNVPRSFMNVIEHPGKIAPWGRIKMELDENLRGDIPDEFLPTFLQSQVGVPISRNAKGELTVWGANNWIPLAQLQELRTPKSAMQFLAAQFSPLWKEPLQLAQNVDFFFHSAIQNYPGETESFLGLPFAKKTAHVLRQVRMFDTFDRTFNAKSSGARVMDTIVRELTATQRALFPLVGRTGYTVQLQKSRRRVLQRMERDLSRLASEAREARQRGKPEVEAALRARRLELQRQFRVLRGIRVQQLPQLAEPID